MKIIFIDKKEGKMKVKVENKEDLWYLYQIINKGDFVSMKDLRSYEDSKKLVWIKLNVEKVKYEGDSLKVLGKIVETSDKDISMGYHSFIIREGSVLEIEKELTAFDFEILKEAQTPLINILIIVFDYGEYTIAELGKRIEIIEDKKIGLGGKDEENERYKFLVELVKKVANLSKRLNISNILFCSNNILIDNIKKICKSLNLRAEFGVVYNTSRAGINEALKKGLIEKIIKKLRIQEESMKVEKLIEGIAKNMVVYGLEDVKKYLEWGAIEEVLISTKLIEKFKENEKWDELKEIFRKAKVFVIDSKNDNRLDGLGGIAGFLRYKLEN